MDSGASILEPLLAAADWSSVVQAYELARSLDGDVLKSLVHGVDVDSDGRLMWTAHWARSVPVRSMWRDNAALLALSLQVGGALSEIRRVDLSGLEGLTDVSPLASAPLLQELVLDGCPLLSDLSPLQGLAGLQRLRALGCGSLEPLQPWPADSSLSYLALSGGSERDLDALRGLRSLKTLVLRDWSGLQDLSAIGNMGLLERLTLSGCPQISDLSPLKGASRLQTFELTGARWLLDLSALGGLTALRRVDLSDTSGRLDLSGLRSAVQLEELDLSGCDNVVGLDALASMPCLEELALASLDTGMNRNRRRRHLDVAVSEIAYGVAEPRLHHQGRQAVAYMAAALAMIETLRDRDRFGHWPVVQAVWETALTLHPTLLERAATRVVSAPNGDRWWPASCPLARACGVLGTPSWLGEAVDFVSRRLSHPRP